MGVIISGLRHSHHPGLDGDGVVVRIAMTVAEAGERGGRVETVRREMACEEDARAVELTTRTSRISCRFDHRGECGRV